jgi:enoyl-[acyl-carrier protein] reductase/trans-2-enoyl-CoA reductase (NAD+)
MKQDGSHEGCIEQTYRLFTECLYSANPRRDDAGRNRVDDKEMRREVQSAVEKLWPQVTTENLNIISDFRSYRAEFLKLFGFGVQGIDYDADVDAEVTMNSLMDLTPQVG